jgi:hypothetical protein
MEALDLSIGIKNQKKIENLDGLDPKGCKAKKGEAKIEDAEEQPDKEIQEYPYSAHLAKNLLEKDPNLDFMDPNRRKGLIEYYLSDPKALPGKEVKPLKNSKLDRFSNTLDIDFDLAANAQVKAIEANKVLIETDKKSLRWCNQYRLVPKSNGDYWLVVVMRGVI